MKRFSRNSILLALLLAVVMLIADIATQQYLFERRRSMQEVEVNNGLAALRSEVELTMNATLQIIHSLASYISVFPQFSHDDYQNIALALAARSKHLINFAAAPDFVITYVYPEDRNRKIIGVDYRNLRDQWPEVERAVRTREMILAGPIKLIQGGVGIVGRAPVYIKRGDQEVLWGIVSSVINFETIMQQVQTSADAHGITFALYNASLGSSGLIKIHGEKDILLEKSKLFMDIKLPNTTWRLVGIPKGGWVARSEYSLFVHLLFLLSAYSIWLMVHIKMEKDRMLEESGRRFKERTRQILEGTTDAFFETGDNLFLSYINGRAEKEFGILPGEAVGKYLWDVLQDTPDGALSRALQLSQQAQQQHSMEIFHPGYTGWYEVYIYPTEGVLSVYFKNVTARVQMQKSVEAAKTEMETILNTTRDGIVIMDGSGRFLYTNPAYCTITGYSKEELSRLSVYDITVAQDVRSSKEALSEVLHRGNVEMLDKQYITKMGGRVMVRNSYSLMPDGKSILAACRDVTTLRQAEENLSRYVKIVDENVITSQTDLSGRITYVSKAFCDISGYTAAELIGENHNIIRHPDMPETLFRDLWQTIKKGQVWHGELKNRKKDGGFYWVDTTISPLTDHFGDITGYMAVRQDITDRKELELVSVTDRLTGIYNRVKLDKVLQGEQDRFERYKEIYSVILLDIDHFKVVNDTFGHLTGDFVLKELAAIVKTRLRTADVFGRWGGEEFLVICPHTDCLGASSLAEQIRRAVESHNFGAAGRITASFGVGCVRQAKTQDKLLILVDNALYDAKRNGRNRVELMEG